LYKAHKKMPSLSRGHLLIYFRPINQSFVTVWNRGPFVLDNGISTANEVGIKVQQRSMPRE
jgi:hypothetical protein